MSIQNIMNVCFAICITLLIYQNIQQQEKIKQVASEGNMTAEIEKCMDLYLATEGSLNVNEFGDEPVYAREQRKKAFQFCSLNWRKGGV